jgi:SH3-like domain-containing protein
MRRFVSVYSTVVFTVMITALLVGQVALAAPTARSGAQVAAAQAAATPTPDPKTGVVTSPKLNVRSSPSASAAVVGKLDKGVQVQIVGSQPAWLQIVYSAGPGGRGWVSAAYIAAPGTKPATPKAGPAAGIPAPRIVAYQDPTFSWQWDGAKQMGNRDWYFDIQFY